MDTDIYFYVEMNFSKGKFAIERHLFRVYLAANFQIASID